MNKILNSKAAAMGALVLVVIVIILTFSIRKEAWWMYIDIFFIFMAVFSHLMALTIQKLNSVASRKLDKIAFWMLILGVVAFIGEWIAFQAIF